MFLLTVKDAVTAEREVHHAQFAQKIIPRIGSHILGGICSCQLSTQHPPHKKRWKSERLISNKDLKCFLGTSKHTESEFWP